VATCRGIIKKPVARTMHQADPSERRVGSYGEVELRNCLQITCAHSQKVEIINWDSAQRLGTKGVRSPSIEKNIGL
jgi:hypothetical protein